MNRAAMLVTGVLCLAFTACVGGRPIHYYAIDRPAASPAPARNDGLVLLLGRIATSEALQDNRIRYRSGGNEAGAYEYHRWTERPAVMVQDLLLQSLRASGKYRQVQEASSAAGGDFMLRGKLYEFSEIDQPALHTRVSLHLELVDRKTSMLVWDRQYDRDEPVKGKEMKDVVSSLEQNLRQLIGEAASGVETVLSNADHRGNQ